MLDKTSRLKLLLIMTLKEILSSDSKFCFKQLSYTKQLVVIMKSLKILQKPVCRPLHGIFKKYNFNNIFLTFLKNRVFKILLLLKKLILTKQK